MRLQTPGTEATEIKVGCWLLEVSSREWYSTTKPQANRGPCPLLTCLDLDCHQKPSFYAWMTPTVFWLPLLLPLQESRFLLLLMVRVIFKNIWLYSKGLTWTPVMAPSPFGFKLRVLISLVWKVLCVLAFYCSSASSSSILYFTWDVPTSNLPKDAGCFPAPRAFAHAISSLKTSLASTFHLDDDFSCFRSQISYHLLWGKPPLFILSNKKIHISFLSPVFHSHLNSTYWYSCAYSIFWSMTMF